MDCRRNLISSSIVLLLAILYSADAFAQSRQSRFRSGDEVRSSSKNSKPTRKTIRSYSKKYNVVEEDGRKVLYKKRNVVEFDGSMIEGEIRNPSDFYFVHRPEEKFGSLLQKRKNFHKEMLRDTVMIR